MKVAVVTWGSRGDFQPYLALAVALRDAGHEVRLGAQPGHGFAQLAADHGIEFVPLTAEGAGGEVYESTANQAISTSNPVKAVRLIMDRLMLPAFDQMYGRCAELADWADVLVSHFLLFAGRMAAETTRTPFVSGTLVPTQLPTALRPPEGLPNLGKWVNSVLWKAALGYMNAGWLGPVNEARTRHGLPELPEVAADGFYSAQLNLVAMSPLIFRRPRDWATRHQMTGYWLLDTPKGWTAKPEVEAFLAGGPAPVLVGFGSMTSRDSRELTTRVLRAIRRAGVRAIVEPGLTGLGDAKLPPGVIVADGVPHSWLLPRVSVLVHHGGAGTAGAAFNAGVPSVFVPHVFDQAIWAKQAQKLGVSPAPVPATKLTSKRLATAIEAAVGDERIRARAERLGDRLRAEDGAAHATRLIEEFARAARAPQRTPA